MWIILAVFVVFVGGVCGLCALYIVAQNNSPAHRNVTTYMKDYVAGYSASWEKARQTGADTSIHNYPGSGSVVVIFPAGRSLDWNVQGALPASMQPLAKQEAAVVVWVHLGRQTVGSYTDGTPATQAVAYLTFVQPGGKILGERDVFGPQPPQAIGTDDPSGYGGNIATSTIATAIVHWVNSNP